VGHITTYIYIYFFFKFVSSGHHADSSHVSSSLTRRWGLSVIVIRLVIIDFDCLPDESYDNIHKFYKVNIHFEPGPLSVLGFVKQTMPLYF
jgi:hypothetical protein